MLAEIARLIKPALIVRSFMKKCRFLAVICNLKSYGVIASFIPVILVHYCVGTCNNEP
jgi:hypothetical protein